MISSASSVSALPRIPVHRNRHRSAPGDPRGGGVPRRGDSRGVGLELCKILDPNFGEFPFRNCLENSRKRLSAPLWWQEAPELGLLPPLLAALGAPIRDLSRISKQFRKECSRKFVPGVAPSLRREASA